MQKLLEEGAGASERSEGFVDEIIDGGSELSFMALLRSWDGDDDSLLYGDGGGKSTLWLWPLTFGEFLGDLVHDGGFSFSSF